jgi:hypothetical protein
MIYEFPLSSPQEILILLFFLTQAMVYVSLTQSGVLGKEPPSRDYLKASYIKDRPMCQL